MQMEPPQQALQAMELHLRLLHLVFSTCLLQVEAAAVVAAMELEMVETVEVKLLEPFQFQVLLNTL
jgi:hypothetical protein